ncbi:hypothetical protein ScPMuIL_012768 [Solemya velum]
MRPGGYCHRSVFTFVTGIDLGTHRSTGNMAVASDTEFFFEGTEKLLEVWFDMSKFDNQRSLRSIDRSEWDCLLDHVKCEIISLTQDQDMDAYVLSESSMFVTEQRFILKTCGRTTLLLALEPLLELVKTKCGSAKISDIFYSHKRFAKPEQQHHIHKRFDDEVHLSIKLFFKTDGTAYTLGRINHNCWHLYTLDEVGVLQPDQTLELLMWEMCEEKMQIFSKSISPNADAAAMKCGLLGKHGFGDVIPGVKFDHFLFDPCGYSMNGLLPGGYYITIHVTPEPHCSYVSFESNVPQKCYKKLIYNILEMFGPKKFLMTLFANKVSVAKDHHKELEDPDIIKGYSRVDHQFCTFKNYNLTYSYFTRPII